MRFIWMMVAALTISGCAEVAARGISNANYLADSAEGYVREVHDDRRWIRERCREILRAQIQDLQAAGEYDLARQVAADHYPSLVTFRIVRDIEENKVVLNDPWPCRPHTAAPEAQTVRFLSTSLTE